MSCHELLLAWVATYLEKSLFAMNCEDQVSGWDGNFAALCIACFWAVAGHEPF